MGPALSLVVDLVLAWPQDATVRGRGKVESRQFIATPDSLSYNSALAPAPVLRRGHFPPNLLWMSKSVDVETRGCRNQLISKPLDLETTVESHSDRTADVGYVGQRLDRERDTSDRLPTNQATESKLRVVEAFRADIHRGLGSRTVPNTAKQI